MFFTVDEGHEGPKSPFFACCGLFKPSEKVRKGSWAKAASKISYQILGQFVSTDLNVVYSSRRPDQQQLQFLLKHYYYYSSIHTSRRVESILGERGNFYCIYNAQFFPKNIGGGADFKVRGPGGGGFLRGRVLTP